MSFLKKDTCYHGHAGMASAFAALANKKLRPGGVLALVLPLSVASGFSWREFRRMVTVNYSDVSILSIAANGNDMAFSSDTGMADCLVIARKQEPLHNGTQRPHFTSLLRRPQGFAQSNVMVSMIKSSKHTRRLEDGPYGGTMVMVGDELTGHSMTTHTEENGEAWGSVRLRDYALAQSSFALTRSNLWLPGKQNSLPLNMVRLKYLATLGFHHLDITGWPSGRFSPRPL